MAKLIYFMPTSLDGYIADEPGPYDWSAPDDEVFAFINDLERPIGICLDGRKMSETIGDLGDAKRQFTRYRQKIQQKCALIVVKRVGQAVDVFPDRSVGDEHGKDEGTRSRHGGFGICTGIMRFMDPRIRRESGNRQEGRAKPAIRQAMRVSR